MGKLRIILADDHEMMRSLFAPADPKAPALPITSTRTASRLQGMTARTAGIIE